MPTGSCLCGNLRYEYTGESVGNVLCHCDDCQKISGSLFSTNALIPESNFKITSGKPSQYTKNADSGKPITSFFCPTCGSTPWRETETFAGNKILKAGTLDKKSDLESVKAAAELYNRNRQSWLPELTGGDKHEEM